MWASGWVSVADIWVELRLKRGSGQLVADCQSARLQCSTVFGDFATCLLVINFFSHFEASWDWSGPVVSCLRGWLPMFASKTDVGELSVMVGAAPDSFWYCAGATSLVADCPAMSFVFVCYTNQLSWVILQLSEGEGASVVRGSACHVLSFCFLLARFPTHLLW